MVNSRIEVATIEDDQGRASLLENKELLWKQTKITDMDGGISKGHKTHLKQLPLAKFQQHDHKINKVVLDWNPKCKIHNHELIMICPVSGWLEESLEDDVVWILSVSPRHKWWRLGLHPVGFTERKLGHWAGVGGESLGIQPLLCLSVSSLTGCHEVSKLLHPIPLPP
jgi:hypothetical protein